MRRKSLGQFAQCIFNPLYDNTPGTLGRSLTLSFESEASDVGEPFHARPVTLWRSRCAITMVPSDPLIYETR